ncbi:MAG: class B sortase [Tractidigestivibacter sp.]|jgi:sortase B|uniref:class B sortase n=1 Tax=Tractidigestivibacter sp. TaxID=2847320 RepID=UPI003D8C02F2
MANSQGKHFSNSENKPAHANSAQGFIPVVSSDSESNDGASRASRNRRNRRVKTDAYRETDPYDLSGKRSRDPKKRRNRIISTILFAVGIGLLVVAAGMWGYKQWEYKQQDEENEKLAQYATVDDEGNNPPVVDWAALKAINPDIVGWIQIPNTVVSFPVFQGDDNDEYLHTNAEGNYSLGGQVFLDAENTAPGMQDQQSIIYGHHLRNGAMFKPIADMDNQEAFDSVSTVWYVTEDATYELEPLFVYYTDENDTNVRIFDWSSEDEFHQYLSDLLGKSVTSRSDAADIIPNVSHVLTLCTCNYIDGYGRTILVCVPKGEVSGS